MSVDESAVNYEYDGVVRRMRSKLNGASESSSGSSVNPFRFVGQWGYYDDGARGGQSGLFLLGVRYYSPEFGRFWSWDALRGRNKYCYCENQSVMCIDPTGYFPTWWCYIFCAALLPIAGDCLALCSAASDIDELRKKINELTKKRKLKKGSCKDPEYLTDCWDGCWGTGNQYYRECMECCGKLYDYSESYEQSCCETICEFYSRTKRKPPTKNAPSPDNPKIKECIEFYKKRIEQIKGGNECQ